MSYLGFIRPFCRHYLSQLDFPKVLEIGIDKGQSAIPLIQNLSLTQSRFLYAGIDVLMKPELLEQLSQFEGITTSWVDNEDLNERAVMMFEENSLDWLTANQDSPLKFDLVLIDGDHNYFTVSRELKLLQNLLKPTSIIICDDYNGRYAEEDMFYSERESYKDVPNTTPKTESEKKGVSSAVNDFIDGQEETWVGAYFTNDPCILYRPDFVRIDIDESFKFIRDMNMTVSLSEKDSGTFNLGSFTSNS
jgi:predicted O-methyltransferase YrrM